MKKLLLFFATAILITSCTAVKFEEPQPAGVSSMAEFPKKMHGTFVSSDNDTLLIGRDHFHFSSGPEVNLEASLSSETAVLKKVKRYYILNLKEETSWDVFPLRFSGSKLITRYANLDVNSEQLILDLMETSPVKEISTEDGKFDHYLIKPSEKEFRKLLRKKLFSEKIVFRRLK